MPTPPSARLFAAGLLAASLAATAPAFAADATAITPAPVALGRPVSFEKDVQPIFDSKCTACHSVAFEESKFNIEDVPHILKGGKRGPAVVPKEPDKSLLYQVASRAAGPAMPPLPNKVEATALTPEELGILRQWILEGATAGPAESATALNWQAVPASVHTSFSLALSADARFAACGRANRLDVYDLQTGQLAARLVDPALATLKTGDAPTYPQGAAHRDFVHALAFSPDQNLLASAGYREVKLWQRDPQRVVRTGTLEQAPQHVAVSTSGQLMAWARDQQVGLWRPADGQPGPAIPAQPANVVGLAFSPDGQTLFTAGQDKKVRAWNITNGQLVGQLETPQDLVGLAISVDGRLAITAHADHVIRTWTMPLAAPAETTAAVMPIKELRGHGDRIHRLLTVAAAPNQLASAGQDGSLRVWDLESGNQQRAVNHGGPVTAAATSPDGQFQATVSGNSIKLWNVQSQQVAELKGNVAWQRSLNEATDDDAVARGRMAQADAALKAVDKLLGERVEAAKKAAENLVNLEKAAGEQPAKVAAAQQALDAAKAELAAKADDAALKKKVTDAEAALGKANEEQQKATTAVESAKRGVEAARKLEQQSNESKVAATQVLEAMTAAQKAAEAALAAVRGGQGETEKPVKTVAFTADGRVLVTSGDDRVLHYWDAKTGKPLECGAPLPAIVGQLAAATGSQLLSVGEDKSCTLWETQPAWKLVGRLGTTDAAPFDDANSPFKNRVISLDFSRDGQWLATGGGEPSRSGELLLWKVADRTLARTFDNAHSDTVFSVRFSRDGKQLLSGAADKFVKIHDVSTGKLVRSLEGHTHHVLGVAWKGDGSAVASSSADNSIKIWNVETGEQARTINNYAKQVTAVHYIGVSDNLVSCSGDKTVKYHRAGDGGNYRGFGGAADYQNACAATRDEAVVLSTGDDGVLLVWNGQNGQVLHKFEPPAPAAPANNQQAGR